MKKAKLLMLGQMMAVIALLIFSETLCAQKKSNSTDYIVFMNGDSLYGKISSVTDSKLSWRDGDTQMDFFPDQVFRVYQNSKSKIFAPSYIETGLEKVKNTKPQIFRINKEKSEELRFAELIQDGEIMVYYFKSSGLAVGGGTSGPILGFTTTKYWCALKRSSGEIIELNDVVKDILGNDVKQRAKALSALIEDEPSILKQFQLERKYSYELFLNYIKKYNEARLSKENGGGIVSERMIY
ncbi:hypothetical protein BV902_00735 [Sphingobacterium sp. B29]|uniref:hypothetical protein n=1 Tax=Sphingobacterium sp. B29 TaxID=1933220 RepID=UPI00095840BD|nr:hypothetical protein [Sphingobacterium sp. B29]APU95036.1 hypothetical protein BV902_00735 [Sphingobacterium sp. B29]